MERFEQLVKALRCCAENLGCPIECPRYSPADEGVYACVSRLKKDAADVIERLIAERDEAKTDLAAVGRAYIRDIEKHEPKLGEWVVFNKQMLINLENAREQYKELGYPHRTELGLQCSNCRKVTYVDSGIKYEFCPHCGAKMEVQE